MKASYQTSDHPKVSVVIVNWNGREDTLACLASLASSDHPSFEIVVVDNGSKDGSVDAIRAAHPAVRLLAAGENLGFAEGNNQGVQVAIQSGAEVVFLLNNDTTVAPDCLTRLAESATELPENSVLGAKILYQDHPDTIWHFGSRWDAKRFVLHTLGENEPEEQWTQRLEVDYIIGCAMWIPCEVIRRIGLFDKRFFLNYEETDLCFRARNAGIRLFSIPEAHVFHKVGSSFRTNAHLMYFCERNRLLWIQKNFHGAERRRMVLRREIPDKLKVILKIVRRSFECVLYYLLGLRDRYEYKRYKLEANCASVLGWIHHFRGRYGDCPPKVRKAFVPSGALTMNSRGAEMNKKKKVEKHDD